MYVRHGEFGAAPPAEWPYNKAFSAVEVGILGMSVERIFYFFLLDTLQDALNDSHCVGGDATK